MIRHRSPSREFAAAEAAGAPSFLAPVRVLFFLSGASALAYEVIWSKQLTLVIGVTSFSLSTVLASFLSGLAIGSLLFGRCADRWRRPLRAYAWLELGVAACALALHVTMPGLEEIYVFLHRHLESSLPAIRCVRLILCFLSLLPPTILMGGTLPLLCRREVAAGEGIGRSLAGLYALNTLGGVAGTLVTGFLLIGWVGLTGTLFAACGANLAATLVALLLDAAEQRRAPVRSAVPRPASSPSRASGGGREQGEEARVDTVLDRRGRVVILGAVALSGFAALAYEVVWTRSLIVFLRSGFVYSFTLILATFLSGIVLGSWIYRRFLERLRPSLVAFSVLEAGIGAWGLLSILLLTRVPLVPSWVANTLGTGDYSWGEWSLAWMAASAGVLLVPCILMGILFPLCGRWVIPQANVGTGVGALYAANTLGSVGGAAAAGFLLVPNLGTLESLRAVSLLSFAIAALPLLLLSGGRKVLRGWRRPALGIAAFGFVVLLARALPSDLIRASVIASRPGKNLYFDEGAAGLVEVYERVGVEGNLYRKLYFNGTSYAGTTQNGRRYHRLLGHLPALLHPDPRTGLVIGFGSGMTFGAMLLDSRLNRVDCVELAPEVLEAGAFFAQDNSGAIDDPKGRILLGDGREHLLVTDEKYDLISLEPPPPRFAGVVNLYSVDFYRLCRSRLREGGMMAQWIPMHSHTVEEMRNLIRSFVEVFPEATFWVPTERDGILVGSMGPIAVSPADLRARMGADRVASDLKSIDVPDLGALLGSLLLDAPSLAAYVRDASPITDDRPTIEYFASFDLFERPGHVEDVMRRGINPAEWLNRIGGGEEVSFSLEEAHHLQAMQQLLLGVVAGDRGDLATKRQAFAKALGLHPDSVLLRRLNRITGTAEE